MCLFYCLYCSYWPDCCWRNSLTLRTSALSLWLVKYRLCSQNCVPQQLSSRKNGEFHGHCVGSLLGSLVLSSVHSTIIITNAFISQTGSYYVINFTLFGIEASYILLHSDGIIVMTLDLGSTSALCNNNYIILVTGYNQ